MNYMHLQHLTDGENLHSEKWKSTKLETANCLHYLKLPAEYI